METKRVRGVESRIRNKFGEIGETYTQYLEELHVKVIKFFWRTWTWNKWVVIDEEEIPPAIYMQAACLGSTDWKSKWSGMPNVKWLKKDEQ